MKKLLRTVVIKLARRFGSEFVDVETGQSLGRGFAVAWRGKVHLIGLEGAVRAAFLPQQRVTYWRQEIGFSRHAAPDFPSVRGNKSSTSTGE